MAELILTTHTADGLSKSVSFNPVSEDEADEIVAAAEKTRAAQVKKSEKAEKEAAKSED